MKTVIIDNSLCTYTLDDAASPEHIYKYIQALAEAGVRYVELDFRTVMKMTELPEGIGYIFRLIDPMFAELAEVFDFNYVLVTMSDLKKRIKIKAPAIIELPGLTKLSNRMLYLAGSQISGKIGAVRLRGSFPMLSREETARFIIGLKNSVTVPIDICPMNSKKTALDCAIKFSIANVDSLTLSMGLSEKYVSFEDYLFTLLSVYETLPREFNMSAVCRAAVYHRLIFRNSGGDSITNIMKLLDYDISHLRNADTGGRVRMHVSLRDSQLLHRSFVSALEKMADEEDIPDDIMADITEALKHYDTNVFNEEIMYKGEKGLLN